jgi:hypothetical protein
MERKSEATNYVVNKEKYRNEDIKEINNGKNRRNAKNGRGKCGRKEY